MNSPANTSSHGSAAVPASTLRTGAIAALGALPVVGELYVVLPLAQQIRDLPGATQSSPAMASTVFAISYALGILVLGPLTDRFGARSLMIASATATAVVTAATAIAPSAEWFLVGRLVQGIAAAAFTPAVLAYIARRCDPAKRVPLNTAAIGAGLASAVVSQVLAQLIAPLGGLSAVLLTFAAATAIVALAIAWLLPADTTPAGERPALLSVYREIPRLFTRPRLILLYCTSATFLSVLVALYTALAADGHWTSGQLLVVRASSLPAVVLAGVLTLRLKTLPARTRILTAIGVAVLGVLACATEHPAFIATGLFAFVGAITLAAPSVVAEVTRLGAPAVGASTSLYTVAIFGGASLGAPIESIVGPGLTEVAITGAAMLAVGGLTAALATRR